MHIEAYGRLLDKGLTIKVEAKTLKTLQPGGDKVSVNRSLPPGSRVVIEKARVGYSAVAYKVYYRDGKEIKREELCRSTYRASGAIIEVGPS
ncbi:MAG: hypothetical protein GX558_10450 [Clostridiales bacterium]|nr:hypothetical protein [Clostridiales bacterium]